MKKIAIVSEYEGQPVIKVGVHKWLNPNGKIASVPIKYYSLQSAEAYAQAYNLRPVEYFKTRYNNL